MAEYDNIYRKKQRDANKEALLMDEENTIGKRYTAEDDAFILENIGFMKMRDIGYCLGKTEYSINSRVKLLRKKGVIK